jgi:hypothetical protein
MRTESRFACAPAAAVACASLAFAASALATPPGTTVYRSVTLGKVARSTGAGVLAPAFAEPARGVRRARRGAVGAASATPRSVAAAASELSPAGALPVNFNGVSSRDSAATNFGQEFEPPDQGLCVGNGYVVEMVNSAYTVYDTAGKAIAGPFNINGPFNEGLTEYTSDPRCYYDAADHTWFATILQINRESTGSSLDVAVNTSGNPSTVWSTYKVDTTGLGRRGARKRLGCPCFGDQPTLGLDAHNLYVSTNEFSILGPQFDGAQIYAFAKPDLVSLSPQVHFAHFEKLNIGGAQAASVQPALTAGEPPGEFFLSSLDPTETFDNRVGVWAMTDTQAVAEGGAPKLSSIVLTSQVYGLPVQAEQKGAASLLEPDEDRMQQTQFINGSLWGALSTAVTIPGDASARDAAAWFQVQPTVSGELLSGASLLKQGYVAVAGNYLLYPALALTPSGSAAMVMTLSGARRSPSAAYAVMAPQSSSFGPVTIAAGGHGPYDEEATRWGDYSWAVADPSGSSVWLATEYVPPKSSQTPDGKHNWGTRVFDVPVK